MKAGKRIHYFAIILWALAALELIVVPIISWDLWQAAQMVQNHAAGSAVLVNGAWRAFEGGLVNHRAVG